MTITIFNENINVSETEPVEGNEFIIEVPLNNDVIFPPAPWDDRGCDVSGTTRGSRATITLRLQHEDGEQLKEVSRDVCVPTSTIGPEERYQFDCTINEPGDVTIDVSVETFGSGRTDQETKSIEVLESGEGEDPGTPGNGDNGDGIQEPGGERSPLIEFAVNNPGATLALAGGAAIAINSFSSTLAE